MKQKQKNKTNKWMWIDQQSNICRKLKCTFQSFLEMRGMPDPKKSFTQIAWNDSHSLLSFLACKLTYFAKFTFIIAYYFGSTSSSEVTSFFASVWLHHNFIWYQNRIFCVNDTKTRPRLNTVSYMEIWH